MYDMIRLNRSQRKREVNVKKWGKVFHLFQKFKEINSSTFFILIKNEQYSKLVNTQQIMYYNLFFLKNLPSIYSYIDGKVFND